MTFQNLDSNSKQNVLLTRHLVGGDEVVQVFRERLEILESPLLVFEELFLRGQNVFEME